MRTPLRTRSASSPAVLSGALLTAAWLVFVGLGVGSERTTTIVSNLGQATAALAAAALCLACARRSAGKERSFWLLLSGGTFSWFLGQCVWTLYESILGRETPFPSAADAGYLGCSVLLAVALITISQGGQGRATRIRSLLDGLLIAGALLLTSWIGVLGPVYRASGSSDLAQVVSLSYPVLDVVVMTLLLYVQLGSRRTVRAQPLTFGLLSLGLLSVSVADSLFAWGTADGWYSTGSLLNGGWVAGFVLIGLAGHAARPTSDLPLETAGSEHPLAVLVPYVALVIAFLIGVAAFATRGERSVMEFVMEAFLSGALMVRQVITLRENLSLTRGLEARVQARTEELAASEQRFRALVRNSSDVTTVVDLDGKVVYQSDSVRRVFGYEPGALVGLALPGLIAEAHRKTMTEAVARVIEEPRHPQVVEIPIRHHDGRLRDAEIVVTNLVQDPAVGAIVLNARDVTDQKALEAALRHQAFHDSLTSLANRELFRDRLEHTLMRRDTSGVYVLYLDVDRFKEVNDSLGHSQGDVLLVEIADRLKGCVRAEETIARLGGDEFAILLERASADEALLVAERIGQAMSAPFVAVSEALQVHASIGIAAGGPDAGDAETLLRNADLAMYQAKSSRCGHTVYESAMHDELIERMTIAADLRRALENEELVLRYQPTISLVDGSMEGVEALVRWRHPTRGELAPGVFIPVAERTGLIREVGRWVLRTACAQAAAWRARLPDRAVVMNVNITAVELLDPGFVEGVRAALGDSGLPPSLLVLELTESTLVEQTEECSEKLQELRRLGVRIAIDDFGTGYSSLSYVHKLPVDVLKIDRSFIEQVAALARNGEIVQAIVALSKSLDLVTVAEGIETTDQLRALESLGCDLGQGFLFAKPLTVDEIDDLLADGHAQAA